MIDHLHDDNSPPGGLAGRLTEFSGVTDDARRGFSFSLMRDRCHVGFDESG
jgi:hypothetical protein